MARVWNQENIMINKFRHKELTLLIGVIVAVIVVFTLWIRQPFNLAPGPTKTSGLPGVEIIKKSVIKNYVSGFEELVSGRSNPYLN